MDNEKNFNYFSQIWEQTLQKWIADIKSWLYNNSKFHADIKQIKTYKGKLISRGRQAESSW